MDCSKKKTSKGGIGAGASPVQADSLSVGSSLFTAGEGRAERGSRDGCCRVGWSEQVPSTKFLPETAACLVTPFFLQIRIVCTLINKSCLSLAGWQVSTMEIISVREKMCLYVKHLWMKLLSFYNSWYGQNCTRLGCLPFRRALMYRCQCWNQALARCCYLRSTTSSVPTATVPDGPPGAGPSRSRCPVS